MKTIYTTRTYVCSKCGWKVKLKIETPKGKEHHQGSVNRMIDKKNCMRCNLEKEVKECTCGLCLLMGK